MRPRAILSVAAFVLVCAVRTTGQPATSLSARIDAILARPAFKHAMFGIEFHSLDTNANNIPVKDAADVTPIVGEALGEIAAAAYDAKPNRPPKS